MGLLHSMRNPERRAEHQLKRAKDAYYSIVKLAYFIQETTNDFRKRLNSYDGGDIQTKFQSLLTKNGYDTVFEMFEAIQLNASDFKKLIHHFRRHPGRDPWFVLRYIGAHFDDPESLHTPSFLESHFEADYRPLFLKKFIVEILRNNGEMDSTRFEISNKAFTESLKILTRTMKIEHSSIILLESPPKDTVCVFMSNLLENMEDECSLALLMDNDILNEIMEFSVE